MATLEIIARGQFNHAGNLLRYQVPNNDPRDNDFDWESVTIDLSHCEFVRPAAVLWCTIYSLLVANKDIPCKLEPPSNLGVRSYLNRLGLFQVLESAGVEIGNLSMPNPDQGHLILPLTRLDTVRQVEELENSIEGNLVQSRLSSANLYDHVNWAFGELANNAVEHADSPVRYGYVQYYDFEAQPRFVCAVADGGIGIRESLLKNPDHENKVPNDVHAIEYALEENVSTFGSTRGLGLAHIVELVLPPNRDLNITSGNGFLHVDGKWQTTSRYSNLFPGTSAFVNVPA